MTPIPYTPGLLCRTLHNKELVELPRLLLGTNALRQSLEHAHGIRCTGKVGMHVPEPLRATALGPVS